MKGILGRSWQKPWGFQRMTTRKDWLRWSRERALSVGSFFFLKFKVVGQEATVKSLFSRAQLNRDCLPFLPSHRSRRFSWCGCCSSPRVSHSTPGSEKRHERAAPNLDDRVRARDPLVTVEHFMQIFRSNALLREIQIIIDGSQSLSLSLKQSWTEKRLTHAGSQCTCWIF